MPKDAPRPPGRLVQYTKYIPLVGAEEIQEVFNHWCVTFFSGNTRGKTVALNKSRRAHIAWGIKTFGVERAKNAITGLTYSEFHMGNNKQGRQYISLELIFRDSSHTSKYLSIYQSNNK